MAGDSANLQALQSRCGPRKPHPPAGGHQEVGGRWGGHGHAAPPRHPCISGRLQRYHPAGMRSLWLARRSGQPCSTCAAVARTWGPALGQSSGNRRRATPRAQRCAGPLWDTTPSSGAAVHPSVQCDGCGTCPVRGPRFKSTAVDNFDLCGTCHARGSSAGPFQCIQCAGEVL